MTTKQADLFVLADIVYAMVKDMTNSPSDGAVVLIGALHALDQENRDSRKTSQEFIDRVSSALAELEIAATQKAAAKASKN